MRAAKGAAYEREVCKRLSLWWTRGGSDAVFWRTSNSGGRATTRRKAGKETAGQQGDVAATDPAGLPLVRLVTIEMKRGYPRCSIGDILDATSKTKASLIETFLGQARRESDSEGTPFWLLIHRRDRRRALVCMPRALDLALRDSGAALARARPRAIMSPSEGPGLMVMTLDDFLGLVDPAQVEALARENC